MSNNALASMASLLAVAASSTSSRRPTQYRHWKLKFDGDVAELIMDVDENAGLFEGYQLKLNSYDLGVDIELADAVQRLRFEHPEVKVVVLKSGKDRVFCAGANIRMLAGSTHAHKVNFCKFTNETRNGMEDASANSGQKYHVRGARHGGRRRLRAGAGDATRSCSPTTATRRCRCPRCRCWPCCPAPAASRASPTSARCAATCADAFCTIEEGVKGTRAVEVAPGRPGRCRTPSSSRPCKDAAKKLAATSDRPADAKGIALTPLERTIEADAVTYSSVKVEIDRASAPRHHHASAARPRRRRHLPRRCTQQGAQFWPLRLARELDDAILHLRLNELEIGTLDLQVAGRCRRRCWPTTRSSTPTRTTGWCARSCNYWKRVLKRIDVTSRSLVALIEPGSLLRRHAGRDRLRLRPLLHVRRHDARATTGRRRRSRCRALNFGPIRCATASRGSRRASSASPRASTRRKAADRQAARCGRDASELGLVTAALRRDRLGRRGAHLPRGARAASPPTASPAWRPTCASPAPRPWRRRSSAA